MVNPLMLGAFRIWDAHDRRRLSGADRMNFALNPDGDLMRGEMTSAMFKEGRVEAADQARYYVEHWTGQVDYQGNPVYEGDVLRDEDGTLYRVCWYDQKWVLQLLYEPDFPVPDWEDDLVWALTEAEMPIVGTWDQSFN
jgi:hypothetical protein